MGVAGVPLRWKSWNLNFFWWSLNILVNIQEHFVFMNLSNGQPHTQSYFLKPVQE